MDREALLAKRNTAVDETAGEGDQASPEGEKTSPLVFNYPEDSRLLARGRFSTLNHERKEQIKRIAAIVTTITSEAHGVLRDCQREGLKEPHEPQRIQVLTKCLDNLRAARERIHMLCLGLQEIEEEAWK